MRKQNPTETAVILAAGRGTRLSSVSADVPKGLLPLGAETLIQRSLRLLRRNGIRSIFIGTGHLAEQYRALAQREGFETFHNPDFAVTGSFHTLLCGDALRGKDVLLLESDLLYEERAIQTLQQTPAANAVLCSGFTASGDEVYVAVNSTGNLISVSKKRDELPSVDAEMVGIWKVSAGFMEAARSWSDQHPEISRKIDYERAFAAVSAQVPVSCAVVPDLVWCEIDDAAHLARAKQLILPKLTVLSAG
jgi:2-aminoethylphosphonate-pyruvate transaminase